MKVILGPYPPPYGGVALGAVEEFERSGDFFIGTSGVPAENWEKVVLKKRPFLFDLILLLNEIKGKRGETAEISAHYATTFGYVAYLAKKRYGIKYTVTCHGSDILLNLHRGIYGYTTRKALENAERIFTMGDMLKDVLVKNGYPKRKIEAQNWSVDREKFQDFGFKRRKQVLYVGAVHRVKGVDVLIDAFAEVAREFPEHKLLVVGKEIDKKYSRKLRSKARRLGIESKVEFLGEQRDIPGFMNESQLLVLPSRSEGYGKVILEAYACGLPVVASAVGGIVQLAKRGKCTLVEPESVSGLEKAISRRLKTISDSSNVRKQ